ncbi:MAG: hypothetical protein FWH21_05460 [Kiritimatiellaeota bacterium]|nr:hypothetical protein [Kiritimatiellota bacterium]
MNRFVQVGGAMACALLLPWVACAQTEDKGEAVAKTKAKRKVPAGLFGMDAKAAGTDAPEHPTKISAKKIDYDYKEGIILFDEDVLVDDAQFTMYADRLIVFMQGTNDVNQIMAIGTVKITSDLRFATCDKAVYTKENAQIVMTAEKGKSVHLETQGDTAGAVKGAGVVMWLDDERVQILSTKMVYGSEDDERATITIPQLGAIKGIGEKKPPEPEEKRDNQN